MSAVKMTIYLSDNDVDRLFEIKKMKNKNDLTLNEFVEEVLSAYAYDLHPKKVVSEDDFNYEDDEY